MSSFESPSKSATAIDVRYDPMTYFRAGPKPPAPSQASAFAPLELPSVAETRWVADGVAYIRFNQFAGEPASVAAIRAFVNDYATADAIIIDTRTLSRG